MDYTYSRYGIEGSNLLRETYPFDEKHKVTYLANTDLAEQPNQYSYLWPYSGSLSAVTALYGATHNSKYKKLLYLKVLPGLEEYFDSKRKSNAYASYVNTAPLSDRFYDDNIWIGIDFTDLYRLTGDKRLLDKALLIWNFIESGKDDLLGGGVYWCELNKNGKNTCSNAPAAVYALKLFEATNDSSFFFRGKELYDWVKTNLQDTTDYLYFDNINVNGNVDKAKYAYNSGQMLQSASLLYKLTNNPLYLKDAQNIASSAYLYFFHDFNAKNGKSFKLLNKGNVWFTAVMLRGYIELYNIDKDNEYINAFLDPHDPNPDHNWMSDKTNMKPELHERKWEIDSPCYVIRLAYEYWKVTGDATIFGKEWEQAIALVVQTFKEQQKKNGHGPYTFQRKTERQLDTMSNNGMGNPVNPVGLIASAFRPSDDATTFQFLIPSNFFAVTSLRKAAEISTTVTKDSKLADECTGLANEVETALKKYSTYNHPKYGTIYAYEVDGFGNRLLMDDANVPSLLAMPYLGDVDINDPIYQNTRKFVWSNDNPYFFSGKAGEGIGGPHIGYDMVWPMSIMMKAFTSQNDEEIKSCIVMLLNTDAGKGFIHESFNKDDPTNYTRDWFAWQNTLFGELIIKLIDDGKLDLLNSIQ